LIAVMIDGVRFAEHVILAAIGIDQSGRKHVLGLREGATENAASCKALLADLIERGLSTARTLLFVLDGAKALHRAVTDVFGERALIQRCRQHKKRNVSDALPERMRSSALSARPTRRATPSAPGGCSSIWPVAWSRIIRAPRVRCARDSKKRSR
jgi:transposase-like protein